MRCTNLEKVSYLLVGFLSCLPGLLCAACQYIFAADRYIETERPDFVVCKGVPREVIMCCLSVSDAARYQPEGTDNVLSAKVD